MDLYMDKRNDPLSKENIIRAIKSAPVSKIEFKPYSPIGEEINRNGSVMSITSYSFATYVADFAEKIDDVIYNEIINIIKESDINDLYVLNKQHILRALRHYQVLLSSQSERKE